MYRRSKGESNTINPGIVRRQWAENALKKIPLKSRQSKSRTIVDAVARATKLNFPCASASASTTAAFQG